MTEKQITETIKEFVDIINFKNGAEIVVFDDGFLDTCHECELADEFVYTNKMKVALISNYLLWFYGSSKDDKEQEKLVDYYDRIIWKRVNNDILEKYKEETENE